MASDHPVTDLEAVIDALSGDWADAATFLDFRLQQTQRMEPVLQAQLLSELASVLSQRVRISA